MTATSDFGSVLVHPGPDVSSRVPNPLDRYLFASALANIDRTPSAARSPGSHRVDEYSHNRIYDPQHPKEISLVDCLFCSDISCACWASFPSTPSSHADSIEAAFQKLVMNAKKDIRQRKFDTLALPPRIKTDIPSLPDTRVPSHTTLLRLWTRDEDLEFPDDILESPDTSCPVTPVDEGWHTSRPARGMPSECSPSECSFGIPLSHRASLRDLDAYYIGRSPSYVKIILVPADFLGTLFNIYSPPVTTTTTKPGKPFSIGTMHTLLFPQSYPCKLETVQHRDTGRRKLSAIKASFVSVTSVYMQKRGNMMDQPTP